MKIEYSSNNSGGYWWLKDEDWINLEKAGWKVFWKRDEKDGFSKDERWLGALATRAEKEFSSIGEAIKEFEKITKQDTSDEGCNCCGAPHEFSWKEKGEHFYASGEDLLQYMFPEKCTHLTKRQLIENQ